MPIRDCPPGCEEHYACRLRAKGVHIAPSATPSRFRHGAIRKPEKPSYEAGIPTEQRPDGSRMPILNEQGRPMRVKEYNRRRREIDAVRKRQLTEPAPPAKGT